MEFNVLIQDTIDDSCILTLNQKYGIQVTYKSSYIKNTIQNYDGLIVRSQTTVDREMIQLGCEGKLKVIGRAGMGLDNIDTEAAFEHGVEVFNVTDGHIYSVAEHTIGLMIALNRHIIAANNSLKSGKWEKAQFQGHELYGKTLGIVGYGQIGQHVSDIAGSMGMHIIVYDPYSKENSWKRNFSFMPLKALFKLSDIVTLHVPLNSETERMINNELLHHSKKGIQIINTSRGKVIDEIALLQACCNGYISGAALDVFEEEPPFKSELLTLDNVIVTPHIASSTVEAQKRIATKMADKIGLYLLLSLEN